MTSDELVQRLQGAVAALRDGWPGQAVEALEPVVSAPELAQAADLQDVRARVLSLYAQALLQCGRIPQAATWAAAAMRILQQHPDLEGRQQVSALQQEIEAAQRASGDVVAVLERHRVRQLSLEELVDQAPDAEQRCEVAVKRANVLLDDEELEQARVAAQRALELAEHCQTPRPRVLAHLTAARARLLPVEQLIRSALAIADASDDFNLVAAVARAARVHGVELPHETIG